MDRLKTVLRTIEWVVGAISVAGVVYAVVTKLPDIIAMNEGNRGRARRNLALARISAPARRIATTVSQARRTVPTRVSRLVEQKKERAADILASMKPGRGYTQTELQKMLDIPYRSVRRYVQMLVEQGKISASGYGKGKRFSRS